MEGSQLLTESEWGFACPSITPDDILDQLKCETQKALQDYKCYINLEDCDDRDGYFRVFIEIKIPKLLFNQLMNGPTGYRAHYYPSAKNGEKFNRQIVEALAPVIIKFLEKQDNQIDFIGKCSIEDCKRSLCGSQSKLWFTRMVTDPSYINNKSIPQGITAPKWARHWKKGPEPWYGLLTPDPDETEVLFNGTFINDYDEHNQNQNRSKELSDTGWV